MCLYIAMICSMKKQIGGLDPVTWKDEPRKASVG